MLSLSGWYAQFSNRFQIPCNVKLLFKTTSLVDMSPELFSKRYGWLIKKANIGPQRGRGCLSSIPTYWYIEKHLNLVLRLIFAIGLGHILSAIWVVHRIATSGPWLAVCTGHCQSVSVATPFPTEGNWTLIAFCGYFTQLAKLSNTNCIFKWKLISIDTYSYFTSVFNIRISLTIKLFEGEDVTNFKMSYTVTWLQSNLTAFGARIFKTHFKIY